MSRDPGSRIFREGGCCLQRVRIPETMGESWGPVRTIYLYVNPG